MSASPDLAPAVAFERTLEALEATDDRAEMAELQEQAYELAVRCLEQGVPVVTLGALAPRFEPAGLFLGSDWHQPAKLVPGLVELTLRSREGVGVECCSQLRLLSIALGEREHPRLAPEEARRFLETVLALNLRSLFAVTPSRAQPEALSGPVRRLFEYLLEALGAEGVLSRLVAEAERIMLTRPIETERVERMIESAAEGIAHWGASEVGRDATLLHDALFGPTALARAAASLDEYAAALEALDEPRVRLEADTLANLMRRTGLVSREHAVMVRHAVRRGPAGDHRLLCRALGIEELGRVAIDTHDLLLSALIDAAVHPETCQAVYGLAEMLQRGVLFQAAVPEALRSLLTAPLCDRATEMLLFGEDGDPAAARARLLAGVIGVLGQPRGVDQGHNPTCQSARAISLWAQIDPGYLLRLVLHAGRDDSVTLSFEGQPIVSNELPAMAFELHPELDPVSLLLTPHLDRVYNEMSRRALGRDGDEHEWVNPQMHGWWVHRGFAALIDAGTEGIRDPETFVRRFYAAYHPRFNGARELVTPQPCGVAMTSVTGAFLDWHAVSIQRVDRDPQSRLRVYFFNPNRDKAQDWGRGVLTSISDHGELMGESSLPFAQFASRLYVFHYEPREVGPLDEVPQAEVDEVLSQIRESWGRDFDWEDPR